MRLVEVTPENDYWNKQKVLYAYDTDRVATLFDESTENEKIYGYQFLNRNVQELIDDDIHSWEDEERIFLKSRGLIPDSWLILYENKSVLVVVSRRRSYRKVLKKPRKNR